MQSGAHRVQAGCDPGLANPGPSNCGLEEHLAIFAKGKVMTSTSKDIAKGSEGEQGQGIGSKAEDVEDVREAHKGGRTTL